MKNLIQPSMQLFFVGLFAFIVSMNLQPQPSQAAMSDLLISTPDPRFGAVEAYLAPELAADLGIGWDRMIISWSGRQPESPDDWNIRIKEIGWVETAQLHGREVVGLLIGTPEWATDGTAQIGVPRGLYLPHDDPENLWAEFVRDITSEYRGRIDRWIIWNEPDIAVEDYGTQFEGSVEDYYQLVKVAYQAARSVNPKAVIHLAGLTHWHDVENQLAPYLERFIQTALQDPYALENDYFFDVATFHVYFTTDTVFDILHLQRRILQRYGLQKEIWLNETNAAPLDDPQYPWKYPLFSVTQDQQAGFILQANALALAAGAERIGVYKLIDEVPPLPGGDSYGLYRPDSSARPAAAAMSVVTNHYAGTTKATAIQSHTYFLIRLDRADEGVTHVAWARTEQDATLRIQASTRASNATLYNHLGETTPILTNAYGWYRLELPAALCNDPNHGCIVGGEPLVLVEYTTVSTQPQYQISNTPTSPATSSATTTSAEDMDSQELSTTNATYTVQAGDYLARIARKNGTTSAAIYDLNKLSSTVIFIGQVLQLPNTQ